MKMIGFWDMVPCGLIKSSIIVLIMETAHTSQSSVYSYGTTQRYIPEDYHLQNKTFEGNTHFWFQLISKI
jgi:hypothetical protein